MTHYILKASVSCVVANYVPIRNPRRGGIFLAMLVPGGAAGHPIYVCYEQSNVPGGSLVIWPCRRALLQY